MSIQSKMTAIADRLRALSGVTEALTLDGMASALSGQQTQAANAFSAVADMGGTVPVAQLPSTLPDAIRTIPTGVAVQRKSGTFTTSTSGTATVSCGFKPDLVVVKVGKATQMDTNQNDPAFGFAESGVTTLSITSISKNSSYIYMNTVCTQSSAGFSVTMTNISSSFATAKVSRTTFSYIAVKYTE